MEKQIDKLRAQIDKLLVDNQDAPSDARLHLTHANDALERAADTLRAGYVAPPDE